MIVCNENEKYVVDSKYIYTDTSKLFILKASVNNNCCYFGYDGEALEL